MGHLHSSSISRLTRVTSVQDARRSYAEKHGVCEGMSEVQNRCSRSDLAVFWDEYECVRRCVVFVKFL